MEKGIDLLELVMRLLTTGSVFVGATAVYAATRNHHRQLNAQIFLAYADRLQSIRRSMRDDLLSARAIDLDPTEARDIPPGAIETLHLVFELFELKAQGYVKTGTWDIWCRDIDRFLNAPMIRQGHEQVKLEFYGHSRFIAWVENRQCVAGGPVARRSSP